MEVCIFGRIVLISRGQKFVSAVLNSLLTFVLKYPYISTHPELASHFYYCIAPFARSNYLAHIFPIWATQSHIIIIFGHNACSEI